MTPIIPDQQPSGAVMELNARIIAAAAVLGDYKAEVASAPVTRPPGREWMLRLASVLGDLLDALGDPADGGEDDLDGLEPYCRECGRWIGIFLGMYGWHHFRGDPAPGGQRQLFDATHEAVVAWCEPPGRFISPAEAVTLGQALDDAETYRRDRAEAWCADCEKHPAGACETHVDDFDQADAYAEVARRMQAVDDEEPESAEYDPGPEVDDEGGMSEYRYILPEDYERGQQ